MQLSTIVLLCELFRLTELATAGCVTSQIIDAAYFSSQIPQLRKMLEGHTDVDIIFPLFKQASPFGQFKISCVCDLECHDFDSFFTRPCRWHNEQNTCNGVGDELDFIRMRGAWGRGGEDAFGGRDKPDGFFLFVGVQQKLPKMYSALLVSDPIQCQQGDGLVTFRHWTTPGVKVRVCIRPPSMGKRFDWCSETVRRNGTNVGKVVIPGSILYTFEIVIEAYGFSLDAFGVQGGAAAIDDVAYNATAIYECQMVAHIKELANVTEKTCKNVECDFETGDCMKKLKRWKIDSQSVGPALSGIRKPLEATFGYVQGPGSASLSLGPLEIPRTYGLQFCYYSASFGTKFKVKLRPKTGTAIELFNSTPLSRFSHDWVCKRVLVTLNGTLEFAVSGLRNKFSFFGLDQIALVDPTTSSAACEY